MEPTTIATITASIAIARLVIDAIPQVIKLVEKSKQTNIRDPRKVASREPYYGQRFAANTETVHVY